MIKLKKVRWSDIFSYGKNNELDLTKDKVVQLVGSNGNGKSSIAWIIEEVLYNKNSKNRKKESLLNWNSKAKNYTIELDFEVDNDEYTIKVKRSSTVSATLIKNGIDISSHTSTNTFKQIEEILSYNFKTFTQIAFQTHSSSLEFLNSPDTARKKFLIDLITLNKYTDIGEIFKKLQTDLSKEITYIEGKLSAIDNWISKNANISRDKLDIIEVPTIDPILVKEKEELLVSISGADATNKRIKSNIGYRQILENIGVIDIISKPTENIHNLIVAKTEASKTIKDAKNNRDTVLNLGNSCPTCMQNISEEFKDSLIDKENKTIDSYSVLLNKLNKDIDILNKAMSAWESCIKKQNEYEKFHSLIDNNLPDNLLDKTELEDRLTSLNKHISNTRSVINNILEANKIAEVHNSKIDLIDEQLNAYREELESWKSKHNELSLRIANISILTKAFSTTGLVAYKLEAVTNTLQDIVNDYLVKLSNGQFQLLFNLSGNDKLNIDISNNGIMTDISSLSAGETTRVNVAVLLGIRKLMTQISGNNINILFLDEAISTLDAEGKEKLVEILLEEEYINTIIVSHEFQHPLIPNINVIKENKISSLIRE